MVIIVSGHPDFSHSHQSALKFIDTAFASNHRISYVFFYADATVVAKSALDKNNNSGKCNHFSRAWEQLANKHQFALIACVSAALKRGVVDDEALSDEDESTAEKVNLHPGFQLEGFSFLAESIKHRHKIIEFCG